MARVADVSLHADIVVSGKFGLGCESGFLLMYPVTTQSNAVWGNDPSLGFWARSSINSQSVLLFSNHTQLKVSSLCHQSVTVLVGALEELLSPLQVLVGQEALRQSPLYGPTFTDPVVNPVAHVSQRLHYQQPAGAGAWGRKHFNLLTEGGTVGWCSCFLCFHDQKKSADLKTTLKQNMNVHLCVVSLLDTAS